MTYIHPFLCQNFCKNMASLNNWMYLKNKHSHSFTNYLLQHIAKKDSYYETKLMKLETNDEVRTTQIAADTCLCQGK